MYPAAIEEYVRPGTIQEAIDALGRYDEGEALFIAGGQSLMQAMKSRLVRPRCLVDLQNISELAGISVAGDSIKIGAMTKYRDIANDTRLDGAAQALRDAAAHVGDRQVRNRGTIGGSVCWNYVAACMPPTTIGVGASMNLTSSGGATRTLAADDFIQGPLETAREENEVLLSIDVPAAKGSGSAYKKWGLIADALPVIGMCVSVTLGGGAVSSARVAIGGLADGPQRASAAEAALNGVGAGDSAAIEKAMATAAEETETQDDLWADSAYRKQLIRSLGAEVTATAIARAQG